jgi:hypothetical protein
MGIFRKGFIQGAAIGGVAATMLALGVPDPVAYFSGAGVTSFCVGIAIGVRESRRQQAAREEAAARSRKPDYNRIAALELDIFGQKFEHDGAPKTPWNGAAARTDSWREQPAVSDGCFYWMSPAIDGEMRGCRACGRTWTTSQTRDPFGPTLQCPGCGMTNAAYRRGVADFRQYPQPQTGTAGYGWTQVSYYGGGTVSVNEARWSASLPSMPAVLPPPPQSMEEVAEAFKALAQVCNYPVCPQCGHFSTGSSAHPEICGACKVKWHD